MLHRAIAEFDQRFPKDACGPSGRRPLLSIARARRIAKIGHEDPDGPQSNKLFRRLPRIVRDVAKLRKKESPSKWPGRTQIWTRASLTHWPTRSLILSATPPITASKHRKTAWRTESQPAGQSIWTRTTTEIKSS